MSAANRLTSKFDLILHQKRTAPTNATYLVDANSKHVQSVSFLLPKITLTQSLLTCLVTEQSTFKH